jgi:adenylate cyclase
LEGQQQLSEPNSLEKAIRNARRFPDNVRLACQTFVTGEGAKVHRLIKDETDRCLFVDGEAAGTKTIMGKQRKLALFFIDIRNFTPFVESHLPFDVIHIMRRIFMLFQNAIEKYQGRIIDTAGDGLYAVFGLETNIQEAAEAAVLAGIQILGTSRSLTTLICAPTLIIFLK